MNGGSPGEDDDEVLRLLRENKLYIYAHRASRGKERIAHQPHTVASVRMECRRRQATSNDRVASCSKEWLTDHYVGALAPISVCAFVI